jgi:hexosaminidase
MRREGLPDYAAVQGYFERRLAAIAQRYQRRVAGWDEIDRAGISRTAIIMAWTGGEAALAASHHGNDVVMTPNPPLYFDAYQGPPSNEPTAFEGRLTTLKMVYDYDPAESLGATVERTHILGAQGNLWTEYIPTPAQLWYMAYPRALALSELCWTPKKNKDWSGFRKRAGIALQRLEPDVTFRIPETTFRLRAPDMTPVSTALNVYHVSLPRRASTAQLVLEEVVPNAEVHYTLDGSIPTALSRRYLRPLALELNGGVAHVAAVASLHGYRVSAPSFLTVGTP